MEYSEVFTLHIVHLFFFLENPDIMLENAGNSKIFA